MNLFVQIMRKKKLVDYDYMDLPLIKTSWDNIP